MKRENILISEDFTTKRVSATKFTAPGDIPAFDSSIHFGKEGNDVTLQNCILEDNTLVKCSPDDTYDFETGALISLMKLCGREKVTKACDELYRDDNYKNALQEMTENNEKLMEENENLKKDFDKVRDLKDFYKKNYNERLIENKNLKEEKKRFAEKVDNLYTYNKSLIDDIDKKNHEIISLKALKLTNESLKKDNESFRKTIDAKNKDVDELKKRINELEIYNDQLEDRVAAEQRGGYMFLKDMEKLQEKFDKKVSDLRDQIHENSRLIQTNGELRDNVKKLEEEKKHLEDKYERCQHILDARVKDIHRLEEKVEKLKLDCEKLRHGYNDADKESLIWCTSQPSIRDQLDSLIEGSKYAIPFADKWLYRIPTKRERMWNDILACDCEQSKYVKVKKEDLETFVKECKEKKIFSIFGHEFHLQEFWFRGDDCIFQIYRKPAGFICAICVSFVFKDTIIDYLPPMRWDLFKKGRIAVKVIYNNYKEFYEACEKEIGKKPSTYPMLWDDVTISICKKDGNFEIFTMEDQKKTGRKIVNWEDVR